MHRLKTMLIALLGLGSVWAAWHLAPVPASGMLAGVAFAQPATGTQPAQPPLSKEMEEQLAELNAAIARDGEIREFEPTEPLPADEAIEMSSEL